ncbi:cytochrome P450 [Serendipita vermifera]|nr:cytochrome P450 [Serendipita vermifera]
MKDFEATINEVVSRLLDSPLQTGVVSLVIASLGYLTLKGILGLLSKGQDIRSYPPGPPRLPLLGALTSFPKDHFHKGFREWAALYGDVVYAPVLGTNMIILNSHDAANELLAKKPNTTAGRHVNYLLGDLMGFRWATTLLQPGVHHSNQRKMFRRGIGPQRIGSYDSAIELAVAEFMTQLETFHGNPNVIFHRAVGRMVSRFTHGEKIWEEMGADLIPWNLEFMELVNEGLFGFWLVDFFSLLQISQQGQIISEKVRYRAYARGLELHKSGTLGHCILGDLVEDFDDNVDVQDATSMLYSAAADTTSGALTSYLLALFLYPEVAQRVYEEIQPVTHGLRLPNIADRVNLPYTEAVFKESVRIRPFMPIRIRHVNTEDEVIMGYFIPKGTVIHQCLIAIFHDTRVWEEPENFKPERFLEPSASEKPNPLSVLFGYGLRVCAGMHLADRVAFQLVATIGALFKVVPFEGKKVPDLTDIEWEDIAVQQPINLECRFIVRDEKAQHLIKTATLHE